MTLKSGETFYPGVEDSVAAVQAKATISDLIDAIVELVTNSDDSYSELEQSGENPSGNIEISIKRTKDGKLEELKISDEAAGINPGKFENIIRYGKNTSAFYEGKSVRGFFGRGLKESIIALGTGLISTIAEGKETEGEYFYDHSEKRIKFITITFNSETIKPSGTIITISRAENRNVRCPPFETLFNRILNHFALREILTNTNRKVTLIVEHLGLKKGGKSYKKKLRFEKLVGQMIVNDKLYLKGFGIATLKLYESSRKLEFSRNDPGSLAGILIKTSNSILENQLFGFDNEPYAHYFFGELSCPGILEKMKSEDTSFLRPDRKGLYWKHKYCSEIENIIKKALSNHIDRKKKQDESNKMSKKMPLERKTKIYKLFKKLNELGRELIPDSGVGHYIEQDKLDEISKLTIFPDEATAPPEKFRAFTVYIPYKNIKENQIAKLTLDDQKGKFEFSSASIKLKRHKKKDNLAIGNFQIRGFRETDKTDIIVRHGKSEDIAEFRIGTLLGQTKKRKGANPPHKRKGGMFKELIFDIWEKDPPQRVYFNRESGILRIYIHYPGIIPYLGENGEGSDSERGSMLLSELVAEAFCRETARRKLDTDFVDSEANLDQYIKNYNIHLKRCIPIIHKICIK